MFFAFVAMLLGLSPDSAWAAVFVSAPQAGVAVLVYAGALAFEVRYFSGLVKRRARMNSQ